MLPNKINSSPALIIAGVLWLLSVNLASATTNSINDNQIKQHSTISFETSQLSNQEAQNGLRTQAYTQPDANRLGDSLDDLMSDNYLESHIAGNQLETASNSITQEEFVDKQISQNVMKLHPGKTRRQMEQQQKIADWWTNLTNENKAKRLGGDVKTKQPTKAPKSVIYREQPLEQNQLITIRNQLMAIRDKHRLLMFRSVPQLMQLDQKLIDSYRLCLKRKMPLYAGMLYRTRDYVVRMANEIVHERQVLEGIAKQIQKVLRQKAQNSTLVKGYNRQLATMVSLPTLEPSKSPSAATTDSEQVAQQRASTQQTATSYDNPTSENVPTGKPSRRTPLTRVSNVAAPIWDDEAENETATSNEPAASINQKVTNKVKDSKTGQPKEESGQGDKQQATADISENSISYTEQTVSTGADDKSRAKFKHLIRKNYNEDFPWTSSSTKKPKSRFYTVNINEVNLKRELIKAQALIDRINVSTHELMTIVDDIVYLFKLTSDNQNSVKNIATSARRLKKMMLKTPIQSFFDRQSKFMNIINPSDMNANNLPEMKPLFDTSNFTSYKDPVDIELGFDSPVILNI